MLEPAERSEAADRLSAVFGERHPGEYAAVLELESADAVAATLGSQPASRAAPVLSRLSPLVAADAIAEMPERKAVRLLEAVDPVDAGRVLGAADGELRGRILAAMRNRAKAQVLAVMSYPVDTAGGVMDPRFVTFRPEQPVSDVVRRLRTLERRRVYDVMVTNDDGEFVGSVRLQTILLAPRKRPLGALIDTDGLSVSPMTTHEDLLALLSHNRATSVAVIDGDRRLLGVIRHDAIVSATSAEASVSIQTMVGASAEERALSSPWFAVRKRLPWLYVNLLTAFLAASVVGLFENTIARYTALAVLLPVVAGQSGNTGAQALAVVLRALALREIRARHWWRVVVKEAAVGLGNGLAVALATCIGVLAWSGSPGLCLVIGSAMVASMLVAGVAGAGIPLILASLGQDPAQSSSILLTTVTDIVGFFSFLGLATIFASLL